MQGSQWVSSDIQGGEREKCCSVCLIFDCLHVSWLQLQEVRHCGFHESDAGAMFVEVMRPRLVSLVTLGKSSLILACVHLFVLITGVLLRHRLVWDIVESSTSLVVRSFSAILSRMVLDSAICTYFLSVSLGGGGIRSPFQSLVFYLRGVWGICMRCALQNDSNGIVKSPGSRVDILHVCYCNIVYSSILVVAYCSNTNHHLFSVDISPWFS